MYVHQHMHTYRSYIPTYTHTCIHRYICQNVPTHCAHMYDMYVYKEQVHGTFCFGWLTTPIPMWGGGTLLCQFCLTYSWFGISGYVIKLFTGALTTICSCCRCFRSCWCRVVVCLCWHVNIYVHAYIICMQLHKTEQTFSFSLQSLLSWVMPALHVRPVGVPHDLAAAGGGSWGAQI